MTPKQKAYDIYYNFQNLTTSYIDAIECAKIVINTVLNDYKNYELHANTDYKGLLYWKEVKQEIEKL